MTDKERLERLLSNPAIQHKEILWAIEYAKEQAERVNLLEERNEKVYHEAYLQGKFDTNMILSQKIQGLEERNGFLEKAHQTNLKIAEYAQEENKRYREALEFYANKKTYKYYKESYIEILKDGGHTARKALEEGITTD